jgi:hypothetical protein
MLGACPRYSFLVLHLLNHTEYLLSVLIRDNSFLVGSQTQQLTFFFFGQSLEVRDSGVHFSLEDWQQRIVFVGHLTLPDSVEGILEGLFLDFSSLLWVLRGFVNDFH